jgi:solute carrier family 8 (sodium/calcium exchanger)
MAINVHSWGNQISDAFTIFGEEDDNGKQLPHSASTIIMHYMSLPWKVIFSVIPPVTIGGGWPCFFIALGMIGGVTVAIGDLAGVLGCVLGLEDSITAITFVALGTSLPDTFASKSAAVNDPTADASIGNVTGQPLCTFLFDRLYLCTLV